MNEQLDLIDYIDNMKFHQDRLIKDVSDIVAECQTSNWGGYGEEPVDEHAQKNAINVIKCLPVDILPLTTICPTAYGDIDFSIRSDTVTAILCVDNNGMLLVGGVYNDNDESFDMECKFDGKLPKEFISYLTTK